MVNDSWEYYQDILKIPAYSQSLGKLVYETANIEAIKFQSTKYSSSYNLAIFTQKLAANSSITPYDPRNELS